MSIKIRKNSALAASLSMFAVIIATAAVIISLNPDALAKRAAEKIGSDALGVKVSIESLHLDRKVKTATITGLNIANPAGYDGALPALSVGTVSIALESLTPELMTLSRVYVDGAVVNLAVRTDGTNLTAISDNTKAIAIRKTQATDTTTPAAKPAKAKEEALFIIRDLLFTNGVLNASYPVTDGSTPPSVAEPVALPGLQLTGLGEQQNGLPGDEVAAAILNQIVKLSLETAGPVGILKGLSPEILKNIRETFSLKNTDSVVEQAKEGLHNLGENLKNLLHKNEPETVTAPETTEQPPPLPAQ